MLPHSRLLLALAALALSSTYALPAGNGVHEARRGRSSGRDSRQENRDNRQAEREARREQERREREERERQEREEREREEREREERRQERERQRQEREAEREREAQERQNARQDRRDARDNRQENRQENREERRENRVENGIGANIRSPKPPPSPPPPMAPDNTPSTPPPYSYPTPYVHDVPTHVGQKVSYTNSGGGFAAMTGGMGVLKAMARQNVLEKLSHVGGNSGGNWLLTQLIWSDSFYTALTDTDRPISDYIKEWGDKYKEAMDDNAAEDRQAAREGRRADRQERREGRQEGREERRRERRGRISDIFPGKRVKEAGLRDRIQDRRENRRENGFGANTRDNVDRVRGIRNGDDDEITDMCLDGMNDMMYDGLMRLANLAGLPAIDWKAYIGMFLEPHVPGISNDDFLYTAPRFGLGRNQNVTYIQQVSIPPDAWAEDHLDDTITLRVNFNTTTATDMWAEKRIMAVPIAQYSSANTSGWLMNDAINGFTAFPTEQVAPHVNDFSRPPTFPETGGVPMKLPAEPSVLGVTAASSAAPAFAASPTILASFVDSMIPGGLRGAVNMSIDEAALFTGETMENLEQGGIKQLALYLLGQPPKGAEGHSPVIDASVGLGANWLHSLVDRVATMPGEYLAARLSYLKSEYYFNDGDFRCIQHIFRNLAVPFNGMETPGQAAPDWGPQFRFADGGFTDNTAVPFTIAKLQQDCPTCTHLGKHIHFDLDDARSDGNSRVQALFMGCTPNTFEGCRPDEYSMAGNLVTGGNMVPGSKNTQGYGRPSNTIFAEQWPSPGEWKPYAEHTMQGFPEDLMDINLQAWRARGESFTSVYWHGNLTTVDNPFYKVKGGTTIEVLIFALGAPGYDFIITSGTFGRNIWGSHYGTIADSQAEGAEPVIHEFLYGNVDTIPMPPSPPPPNWEERRSRREARRAARVSPPPPPSAPLSERVQDGWCNPFEQIAVGGRPNADSLEACVAACDEMDRCTQAVFEDASSPWGAQCFLGKRTGGATSGGGNRCARCTDHCYNKNGFSSQAFEVAANSLQPH